MKILKFIALAAFALLFSECKSPMQATQGTPSVLEVHQILDSTKAKFYVFANTTNGNPQQAIILAENWLNAQPTVASAIDLDSTYIYIKMKSGLTTVFYFALLDPATGMSITRGAPQKNPLPLFSKIETQSAHSITNKNVLIYSPPFDEFYTPASMQKITDIFDKSGLDLTVTVLKGDECTYQMVDHFHEYGLVILDTHGLPDAFLVGKRVQIPVTMSAESELKKTIDAQIGEGSYDRIVTGDLLISGEINIKEIATWYKDSGQKIFDKSLWMSSKHIASLTGMNNTAVFGNMCYSGWNVSAPYHRITVENPIASAFMSTHPISYYCYAYGNQYSTAVNNDFAQTMEDSLVRSLVIRRDSTGHAYKRSDNTEFTDPKSKGRNSGDFFFKHYGYENYSYDSCGGTFTDGRDGQVYKTVCIGKQKWMAQDLNYDAPGSRCYFDDAANCQTYGRLYSWASVMNGADSTSKVPSGIQGICPKGWHVPSAGEFDQLINFLGGSAVAGGKLKDTVLWNSPNTGATNLSGFSALPTGYYNGAAYVKLGLETYFLTTSKDNSGSTIQYYLQNYTPKTAWFGGSIGTNIMSCRCVKD